MRRPIILIVFILLLAYALRVLGLTEFPPGLTHDEANHGWEALQLLGGRWLYYFPLGYGREPLYAYLVAGMAALIGDLLISLRYLSVLSGLLAIAVSVRWARQALGLGEALLAAALMAVAFWPLVISRQALRSSLVPLLMTILVTLFWTMLLRSRQQQATGWITVRVNIWLALAFGLGLGALLHTYIAARLLWILFPLFLLYLGLWHKKDFRSVWRPTLLALTLGGLLAWPLFFYLGRNPGLESRLDQLDGPLQALRAGQPGPIVTNAGQALLAQIWPGAGDMFLAYNIPGRPVMGALLAISLVAGVAVALLRWRRPAYMLALLWWLVGITPSLITGATANTTRNVGALTVTYILAASGLFFMSDWLAQRLKWRRRLTLGGIGGIVTLVVLLGTVRSYFARWGGDPGVRAAYQHTLVEMLQEWASQGEGAEPAAEVVISTVNPGPAHDPTIGLVVAPELGSEGRWVDGRAALIFPRGQPALLYAPSSTPLHPHLATFVATTLEEIALRPDDLDPSFGRYSIVPPELSSAGMGVDFNGAVSLMEVSWLQPGRPGEVVELVTIWEVIDPTRLGPLSSPAFTSDLALFTHVLAPDGTILAQQDGFDAPSWSWRGGDVLLQIHQIPLPSTTEPGSYPLVLGIYDRASGERLPLSDSSGTTTDTAPGPPLIVE